MYNNPSKNHVRVDETFEDGLASSLFDFSNVTKDGLVDNTLTSVFKDFAHPDVWRGYVNTNYPLIAADFLAKNGAVFAGLVDRQFLEGKVASVRFCPSLDTVYSVHADIFVVEHHVSRRYPGDGLCGRMQCCARV